MIHYILQIIAIQLLFLIVYDLFLKKETFFNGNRFYLIATPILSFVLPLVKINAIRQNIPQHYLIELPEILINGTSSKEIVLPTVILGASDSFFQSITLSNLFLIIWSIGALLTTTLFLFKIYKIISLKKIGIKTKVDNFTIISLPNTNMAFSFFKTIFVGELLSEIKKTNILLHEKTHVSQYHSVDLIFFEILRILFWFNPLVYIYQKRVAMLQEYIADAKAVSETGKKEYYQDLLSQIFQTDKISFINTFFNHSLIKNRIIMLQKSKSKKIFQLKYLLLLPLISAMLIYTSCSEDINAQSDAGMTQKTPLIQKIEAVKHQIEIQGNVSPEEEKALKLLSMLVNDDFSNPAYKGIVGDAELPFMTIEKAPIYPGCEGKANNQEAQKCFMLNIKRFIGENFDTTIGKQQNLSGKQKVVVRFKIDNTGKIVDIYAKGPHSVLEEEAKRVISSLPKMTPGQQDGVPVGVLFSQPIVFDIKS